MNDATLRFGSDHGGARSEDVPLLTGRGRFSDDLNFSGQLYAAFVRAPVAHADIDEVDTKAALAMPGVIDVFTGADLVAASIGAVPVAISFNDRNGQPMVHAPVPVLAHKRIRYAGEAVAIVVAETQETAQLGTEAVYLTLRERPAVATVIAAQTIGAPVIHDAAPNNIALDWTDGDTFSVDAAFNTAVHVVETTISDARLAPASMEPRAGIGEWDEAVGRYTLTAGTQGVNLVSRMLAEHVFKVEPEDVRVVTHDVGGGFGMKSQPYSEYAAILFAARATGRPIKWANTRLESFQADTAGRDGELEGRMAFDADGRVLAFKFKSRVGMGAYISTFGPVIATNNTKNCLSSVYAIPEILIDVELVLTNTAPLGPYRGAGRPEAIIMIERLLDLGAAACGLDRTTIRRRNLISSSAMPYETPIGQTYDSGEFEAVLDRALVLADWNGFASRRAESEAAGKLRGIGVCCFLEIAGGILNEPANFRIEDGKAVLRLGVQAMGQGHLTTYTNLIADRLGIATGDVVLIEGDSAEVPGFIPSVASRSLMMAGSAAVRACDEAVEKGRVIAGELLEAAIDDIEYGSGIFRITGTDRTVLLLELPSRAIAAGLANPSLDTTHEFVSPQMSFPNGCHVSEVEIDPETGFLTVVGYYAVDDVGNVFQKTIVEGQIHGGIVQGLGQVLGEQVIYDDNGQLLTGSFMDYPMPRADEIPSLTVDHHSVPCTNNPLGVKGAGESGVAGALPSAYSAVLDALAMRGVNDFDLPATPARIWSALQPSR